jgi:hypothetical protein
LSIRPRGGVRSHLAEILPDPLLGDVMGQRCEPKFGFTPSLRCYSFESCFHGWRFFSLHRRPYPPVVWSPCCRRTTHLPLAASPCSRLSRPPSTISQSDCCPVVRSLSLCWLVGPYKSSLEPDGSPLFPWNHLVACQRYEPRKSPSPLAMSRLGFLPSPVRDRVGDFEHDRFRGYLSVHWVPACNLPVYASQCDTRHHARLGTRLRARRCRGRHCRRLDSTSFQGATLTDPSVRD